MEFLEKILETMSHYIWGNHLMAMLIGTGIFYTILTKGVQFRAFGLSIKQLMGVNIDGADHSKSEGTVSAVQALCTALSSCVGNGNIVGVATAIAAGGPGAIVWMWISAVLGMATKYAEILIGIIYREKNSEGSYVGGPMYYLSKGLGWKKISAIFAVLMLLQVSGGALIQSNAVADVLEEIFNVKDYAAGIFMSIVIFAIISGGIKRLAIISKYLVPFMCLVYIGGGLFIIFDNLETLPSVFSIVIKSAFNVQAVGSGVLGHTIKESMRYGLARGLYSNEAGEGSAPVLHSAAITNHPAKQGLFGIVEVFIDTIVMCSFTSLIVLASGIYKTDIAPTLYVMNAFSTLHPYFKYLIGLSMVLFAFSSLLAQWYFGNVTLTYLFDVKAASYFKYIFVFFPIVGAMTTLKIVWSLQDVLLGIMIMPNLVGIILLHKEVIFYTNDFFNKLKEVKKS